MPELYGDRLFNALEKTAPAPGMLLVSAPRDTPAPLPRQDRRVHLVLTCDEAGSTAVTLGLPTALSLAEVAPSWLPLTVPPEALYLGGEDHRGRLRALGMARNGARLEETRYVVGLSHRLVAVDLEGPVEEVSRYADRLRFFVGEETWAPGELEDEVERGEWYVTPALPSDTIVPARVDLWSAVLRRQPMPLPLFNSFPAHLEGA